MTMMDEKRRARRFDLHLPVTLLAVGEKKARETVRTRDISSSGMFLELDANAQAGTRVELMVDLPQEITQAGTVRLSCTGRVVRVDKSPGSRTGLAVKIERYQFMRIGEEVE